MPKDYFSIDRTTSLAKVKSGAKIHVIGVSGVAMAQTAIQLSKLGFKVSGSDKDFYEPMGSLLAASQVELKHGYKGENVPANCDLVLIGNVVSYGHPEVEVVEKQNLPYTCFPKLLQELLIAERYSLVISGTHGKTTTSAWLSSVLEKCKLDPSYFIGGASLDLASSLKIGKGKFAVVEGDEYDSAFFAKVPKFTFYAPNLQVITSVEFDHADIYDSLEQINSVFSSWVLALPAQVKILACMQDKNLSKLVKIWRSKAKCKILTYGSGPNLDYQLKSSEARAAKQFVRFSSASGLEAQMELSLGGQHNAFNALAVWAVASELGLDRDLVQQGLSSFRGVKRRQELRYDKNGIMLIEDFAHHPTAVHETLKALRAAYPAKRIWAVFEPRTNTSRRKVFQQAYIDAFKVAQRVTLCEVQSRAEDSKDELVDVSLLAKEIAKQGPQAESLANASLIANLIISEVKTNDLLVVMSNGSFGGLLQRLLENLPKRV